MRYLVRHISPAGQSVVETMVQAASQAALHREWQADRGVLLSVQAQGGVQPPSARAGADFLVAWWCRELRTLLTAGMTVVEALETLNAQPASGERARVQARLVKALHEGQTLSKAMRAANAFPEVLIAGVTASERTGTLVAALDDYLRYADLLEKLRKQVVSAAIYPLVVVGLGALIAVFLLAYVIPRFSRMYTDFHGTLSTATTVLLAFSRAVNEHGMALAGVALGAAALLVLAWRAGLALQVGRGLLGAIPLLDQQWDHFRMAKLYQSLALMFRGGYTLDEALDVAQGLDLGGRLKTALPTAQTALRRGQAVSECFEAAGLTEPVSQRLLAVGERTGSFAAVLQTIADRHADRFTVFIERTTRIVEPLLLLMVALLVGGIVIMMYMPIFDIANGVR